jgi:hypothetical protein
MEITNAFELKKPFIFLRECDEKVAGFATFDQARASVLEAEQAGKLPSAFTETMKGACDAGVPHAGFLPERCAG